MQRANIHVVSSQAAILSLGQSEDTSRRAFANGVALKVSTRMDELKPGAFGVRYELVRDIAR